ncbi:MULTISPECIES: response regulator transcription factor [unclassified Microbacterium]|uniref:response regulator n=1 Tax=unclassified Microbacterium TaxID=2609290 RepID=UPI000CFC2F4B|nr:MULTISPECIES: response regulator transcription factor [unclassified Microbacterium]PQZ59178.1 DNA-binding response regulator [Microbacterium sp. MYb43]PQZ81270.1 DNA-binding response regulator [Microbacterium sp. MYb40]PRB21726.1 DNA-binding response regulator [Microbacterium sp. MYb54]PRB31485.1 DNA-binding response regulator [Microbacterium sp. MYb50]PRB68363.1 DNA-binding response regulator [Microbacterium sp. MYb24]
MTEERIRVLIVDDHELIRRGMRMVLDAEDDIQVVGEAVSGAEAVHLADDLRPDVVLMDIRMPEMDGIEATRRIVRGTPTSRVLVLTTFDLDEYAFGSLRAGASGFLLKNTPPAQLTTAIRAIAAGDALVSPRVTRSMLDLFATRLPRQSETDDSRLSVLTERERDVFLAIAKGYNNTEIGESLYVSESTVKTHVGRILMKLDLRDRVQAVILAYEAGLV